MDVERKAEDEEGEYKMEVEQIKTKNKEISSFILKNIHFPWLTLYSEISPSKTAE